MRDVAGLALGRNTLEPVRETEVVSWVDRGPYGPIEDWKGWIEVNVLPRCTLSKSTQIEVAKCLAMDVLPHMIDVERGGWTVDTSTPFVIRLRPRSWTEHRGMGFEVVR